MIISHNKFVELTPQTELVPNKLDNTPHKNPMQLRNRGILVFALVLAGVTTALVYTLLQIGTNSLPADLFKSAATQSGQPSQNEVEEIILTSPTFSNEPGKFSASDPANWSFEYPTNWTIETRHDPQPYFLDVYATLTSPSKVTKLNFYITEGGRGGYCPPEADDIPHQAGNTCPTKEYLSKEKIGEVYKSGLPGEKTPIFLVTYRFTDTDTKGESSYVIGISSSENIELNKPLMGLFNLYENVIISDKSAKFFQSFDNYAEGETQSFLSSAEGEQVKTILRSFRQY